MNKHAPNPEAERLAQIRRAHGISQREVAKRWKRHPAAVCRMEKSLTELTPETAKRIEKILAQIIRGRNS